MTSILEFKTEIDDFVIAYESIVDKKGLNDLDQYKSIINDRFHSIDSQLNDIEEIINRYNEDIEKLSNNSDGKDYLFAVISGILTGMIDIVINDDFSFEAASSWGAKDVEKYIMKKAKKIGYKGDNFADAIKKLEDESAFAGDKATAFFGGGKSHHLRDFSHHRTPVGLFFSILTQFTHRVYGTDNMGTFSCMKLDEIDSKLIGKNIPEKLSFGIMRWILHMASDMSGSSGSVRKGSSGTGIPGFFLGTLKEISSLPIFKNEKGVNELSNWIAKLFDGKIIQEEDSNGNKIPIQFDFRTEVGMSHQIKLQSIPIIFNECMVRCFYFLRRLCNQLKNQNINNIEDLRYLNWKSTLPFKNRTIIRMIAISQGIMSAIDITEATVESTIESGMNPMVFAKNMIIKVNFAGIGKLAISINTDISMEYKKNKFRENRIKAINEYLILMNGKLYYKQAEVWLEAIETGRIIQDLTTKLGQAIKEQEKAYKDIDNNLTKIKRYTIDIEEKNKGLIEDINDILEWE